MAQRINTKVAQNCCQPVVGANTQLLVISLNLEVEAKPKPRPPNSPEVSRVFDGVSVEGKSFFVSEGQRTTISEMFMAKVKIHGDSSDSSSTFFRWATTATRPQASSFISLCVSDSGGSLVESRQAKIRSTCYGRPERDDVIPSFWVNWYYPVLEGNITKCFALRCGFQDDEFCGKLCSFDALRNTFHVTDFKSHQSATTFRDVLPRKDLLFFAIYSCYT